MRPFIIATLLSVFISCNSTTEINYTIDGESIPIDKHIGVDSTTLSIYQPYKKGLDSIMNKVLCYSPYFLEKQKPEARLNNWMADVCFEYSTQMREADFCLLNYGGIRSTLPKGDITSKDIFQLMPFDNELVIVEIPNSSFTKVLDYLKMSGGHPISNINLNITDDKIECSLKSEESIRIVTSDYLANGGDKMFFFADSISMINTGLKIREVLLDECKSVDTLISTIDNRFVYE